MRSTFSGARLIATAIRSVAVAAMLCACSSSTPTVADEGSEPWTTSVDLDDREQELWEDVVTPYLAGPLWDDDEAYDAGHSLMLPLEAAFRSGSLDLIVAFERHFSAFNRNWTDPVDGSQLNRLQYLHLVSRYLVLAAQAGRTEAIPHELPERLSGEIDFHWNKRGIRRLVSDRVKMTETEPSTERIIADEWLHVLAIAANLVVFADLTGKEPSSEHQLMVATARRVVEMRGRFGADGGWQFQPGVWADHPDYAFANVSKPSRGMVSMPLDDVGEDSSHSARWPIWLRSFIEASPKGSEQREVFERALDGLASQFLEHTLVLPTDGAPYLRMTNYVDGHNGLYRWDYATSRGNGYLPYQLSGSLYVLWWSSLPDKTVGRAFCDQADAFPLPNEAIATYVGPNTTRQRNPLVAMPAYLTNGFAELQARLACTLRSADGAAR